MTTSRLAGLFFAGTLLLGGCAEPTPEGTAPPEGGLAAAFDGDFLIGAALNEGQFSGRDPLSDNLMRHFNTITAENVMKWESIHPEPGQYSFDAADRFVAFGEERDQFIVGHTLVWHSQTPDWVFENADGSPASRDTLLARMEDHIRTVVGRYKGRVDGWDVVNEALNEDGTLRDSPWRKIIGDDYIARAFQIAHEVDPDAELYYNDYSLPNAPKRNGTVRLVQSLLDQGIPVKGIGMQGHYKMDWPTAAQVDSSIKAFNALGVDVMFTELDIDVLPRATGNMGADVSMRAELADSLNPYVQGLPDDVQRAFADRYAELFQVFADNRDAISRVTFWGVHDGATWLNGWPVPGRTNHPLLFDRQGNPKPALEAVMATARK